MEKLEMRARARAAAHAAGLFELGRGFDDRSELRSRTPSQRASTLPPPVDAIDEAQARAACKPMGELEFIVNAADARGQVRALYVIVPDLALKSHYERLGFEIESGCRVLLDAAALLPIAVLRMSERTGPGAPPRTDASAGFNPYFDVPTA